MKTCLPFTLPFLLPSRDGPAGPPAERTIVFIPSEDDPEERSAGVGERRFGGGGVRFIRSGRELR